MLRRFGILKVFSVFQHWPVNLSLSSLMQKGAFLMAIVTAKRAHELASLLSDANHFTPTCLTKTDRPGHLCPPFYVKAWKKDLSICPVETVCLILQERDRLHLKHNAIFFSWMHPHDQLDAAAFNRCIQHCLVQAGIKATSGSTRSVTGATPQLISDFITPYKVYYKVYYK
jgi:hypothetical protein